MLCTWQRCFSLVQMLGHIWIRVLLLSRPGSGRIFWFEFYVHNVYYVEITCNQFLSPVVSHHLFALVEGYLGSRSVCYVLSTFVLRLLSNLCHRFYELLLDISSLKKNLCLFCLWLLFVQWKSIICTLPYCLGQLVLISFFNVFAFGQQIF